MKKILFVFMIIIVISFSAGCQSASNNETMNIDGSLKLNVEAGEHWQGSMKILFFSVKKNPQMAAWIEDENGNYITTISVTERSAKKNWNAAPKEGRPEALPVWNQKLITASTNETDIVSSASKNDSVSVAFDESILSMGKTYRVFLEINHSFDYNDVWTKDNSGVNGQPSLIYEAKFVAGNIEHAELLLAGHGSLNGADGTIDENLEGFTSALGIIDSAWIDVK